jgi:hypothetical protein
MRKFVSSLLLYLIIQVSYSQQVKIYQGAFKGVSLDGNVEYEYYEDGNGDRIYCGNFKFVTPNILIIGTFKNNKKRLCLRRLWNE